MDNLKYFVRTNAWTSRSNPAGFLRIYRTGHTDHTESFNFFTSEWDHTDFFLDYDRGSVDDEYEEVPAAEAERLLQERLRQKAEREQSS